MDNQENKDFMWEMTHIPFSEDIVVLHSLSPLAQERKPAHSLKVQKWTKEDIAQTKLDFENYINFSIIYLSM